MSLLLFFGILHVYIHDTTLQKKMRLMNRKSFDKYHIRRTVVYNVLDKNMKYICIVLYIVIYV